MWDPGSYLRYGEERSRPFGDLLARIGADRPRAVVDLGCGPGHLTAELARRWPDARVRGLDSSPEMIERARTTASGLEFAVADVRDYAPTSDVDVLVSNATLQWVPGHEDLLRRWAAALPPGAWLAVQVPGNFDAPSHQALRRVAAAGPWRSRLAGVAVPRAVPDPAGYARLLRPAGCAVDAWETTYLHALPVTGPDHPVLGWMEGTALRPVRAALDDPQWRAFRSRLAEELVAAYPATDGIVDFPFRRVFVVARTRLI